MKTKTPHKMCKKLIGLSGAAIFACFAGTGLAQVTEMLHETQDGTRDNYTGVVGNEFRVGSSNVVVSHLGIYDNNGDGLAMGHSAGLFNLSGSTLLAQVAFAAGGGAYLTNSVRWMPLDPPLLLSANTSYVLAADVFNASGDPWADSFVPANWNTRFVGTNGPATRSAHYSPAAAAWPTFPASSFGSDNTYGNVNLAYIEIDKARVGVAATNLATSVGQSLSLSGFASGAATIAYQWYKAPATPLTGRTTASFTIASAAQTDSGTYYLTATNSLGGSQSANISVTVTAFPVGIQQGPTNFTVLGNYTAAFSAVVTGSPPISVQWRRNGTPIAGATSTSYSFTATSANNGDLYSIFASNNVAGTPHTATSSSATLSVIANLAQPQQILHGVRANLPTNTFVGSVGGSFITGNRETLVTHLGYYATKYTDATHADLTDDHAITIYNADYTANVSVVVGAGTGLPVVNGYIWAALNPPATLAANTTYILGAETSANDPSGDTYVVPDWSSYYTDPANANSFAALYNVSGSAPYYGGYNGQMYSAPNMAILPFGAPSAWVSPTAVTQYAGLSVTLTGLVNGQAPVTGQWYKAPGTLLTGQTNLTLTLLNPTVSDSGDYFLVASNSLATAQSGNAAVSIVPDVGPSIVKEVQSQTVLVYSTVNFVVTADGTPPLSYQWSFNGSPISGATNSVYTVYNASSSSVGNYRVAITNLYGLTNSAIASLDITAPAWGSYPSAVMGTSLLAYYRFSDVSSGWGVATNMGSLGFTYDGTYEGVYSATAGPTAPNFENGNQAVSLDGLTSDVMIPALNVTVTNATIAAWVYSGGGQPDNSAIYYHRGGSVFGLAVFPDTNALKYTWAGGHFNFETGLLLPANQWAFVALVITPTNASFYLEDGTGMKAVTNVAAHSPVTFDSASYAGWDTAGGSLGRRWTGGVDELMIFNRALSPVEVNALYLGVPGSATLTIARSAGNLLLTWPGGKLLEAIAVTGPWTTNNAASSPYTVAPGDGKKFYRVQLQP